MSPNGAAARFTRALSLALGLLACAGFVGRSSGTGAAAAVPLTFVPSDDAFVRSNFPTETTGAQTTIRVYKSGSTETHAYLRFVVTGIGGPPASATLRLFVTRASAVGGSVYAVTGTSWSEQTITWTTKPAPTGAALARLGAVATNTWVEVDLTSAITGDGTYAFVLEDGGGAAWYSSAEGSRPPQLLVTPGSAAVAPTADFTAAPVAPLSVAFTDTSAGAPATWAWDLDGDSVADSNERNPTFTYAAAGTYSVTLTATNSAGTSSVTKSVVVDPPPSPPPPGTDPLSFSPLDDAYVRSNYPTEITGGQSTIRVYKSGSTETHSYLKFVVTGIGGRPASAKLRLYVDRASATGGGVYVVPDTSWTEGTITWQAKPSVPGTFVALVGPATLGTWVEVDLTPAIAGNGTYTFVLKDGGAAAWFSSAEGAHPPALVVTPGGPPVSPTADFTATPTAGTAPLTVGFTDTSTGPPAEWVWDLDGDNLPDSNERNPTFTYTAAGTYSVALTVTNGEGTHTTTKTALIAVAAPTPPENVTLPQVVGVPRQWSTLTATNGAWNGSPPPTFSYRWLRCDAFGACPEIAEATTGRYLLSEADVGSTIRVVVTARNVAGSAAATSEATGPVAEDLAAGPVIAAAGDIACNPQDGSYNGGAGTSTLCHQKATSDLLVDGSLTAVLALGDLQYEKGEYEKFVVSYDSSWGRVKAITYPVPGNHEYGTPGAPGYYQYFGAVAGDPAKGYYSLDIGAWHLIALNSNCNAAGGCGLTSPQVQWLRGDLAAHPVACTLAYWHHPRFSSGDHGNDTLSNAFWQTLYELDADVVLNGHDHNYERFAPQSPTGAADPARGIREFVVGTGGKNQRPFRATIVANSEVREAATFGVLRLTLRTGGYDWRFVPEAGKTFTDSGSGDCH